MPVLPAPEECFVLFENTRNGEEAARLYVAPVASIQAWRPEEVLPAIQTLAAQTRAGRHACGYLSYEAGYVLQGLPQPDFRTDLPLLHFELFADCHLLTPAEVATLFDATEDVAIHDATLGEDATTYAGKIARIHALIRNGDTYQVNYTLPYRFAYAGSPLGLYRALRQTQRVEFAAFLNFAEARVLSLSPELFLRRTGNTLLTRPMKGTAPRGRDAASDAAQAQHLQTDPKSRAENLMIVDLLRNDLGRVAQTGSVKVSALFEIETFETLHQMTSSISGTLPPEASLADILSSLFPCGSITGAPKRHTMQIIAELEPQPRGIYTGAIGFIAPGGDFCFNVPIRTVVSTRPGEATMGVGSGIVHDSVAAAEYAEVQLKTQFLQGVNQNLGLIESMRLEADDTVTALDLHLARLAHSAATFGFACDVAAIKTAVLAYAQSQHQPLPRRLRLLLQAGGQLSLQDFAIPALPDAPQLLLSPQRIAAASIFRRHKTSVRTLYENEYARATAAGAYEVLFLNEQGEVAECARHNLFIQRNGKLITPPVEAGALPGILRQQLIASGRAEEGRLTLADLAQAEAILIGNAVRGLQQVGFQAQDNS